MSTILELVQEFTDKLGLPTPGAVIGATDKSTKQYRALLRSTIRDLRQYRWQQQRVRMAFTTVGTQNQGKLQTLFPGYIGLVRDTMWNDTRHMRILGPVPDQVWNALQTLPNAGPEFLSYISNNTLFVSPLPVAGESISAIVVMNFLVVDVGGSIYREFPAVDSDSIILPDDVVLAWFEYKWRQQKGEPGWEDLFNSAVSLAAKNLSRDGMERLSMSPDINYGPRPGIIIPPGNWPVV